MLSVMDDVATGKLLVKLMGYGERAGKEFLGVISI